MDKYINKWCKIERKKYISVCVSRHGQGGRESYHGE